ncbi:hypothetical protein GLIP_0336 [Aliiglaciecola lipolytica E3]|uniref:Uncharacterized protein n=1 Tax=Aliiglaciecola lipolytica E3 TaxID=1127673 RepID=K6XMT0_9ALTE|nr:hypothetical protein GLIP_0336 [Aliiglaciecola lipolytica E3]
MKISGTIAFDFLVYMMVMQMRIIVFTQLATSFCNLVNYYAINVRKPNGAHWA